MTVTELVRIFSDTDATRAEIIKGFLQSEGIRCFLEGEQTAVNLGLSAFEVNLAVPAGDADRARKLIEHHRQHFK